MVTYSRHFDMEQDHCQDGDVFTSCRYGAGYKRISRVTYGKVQQLLKKIAYKHGLDAKVFGTHSFRILGQSCEQSGSQL